MSPQDVTVNASGDGSVGIGHVGRLTASLLGGDWREVAQSVRRWSGWNWPQFFLVLLLDIVAFSMAPEGPARQLGWVYASMATALVLSFCRVAGVVGALARKGGRRTFLPPLVSLGCVVLASLSIVGMDHYADHGEADVTGRARIVAEAPLVDGERLVVTVPNEPHRDHLRLGLVVSDAAPGAQSCVPGTTYEAKLKGSSARTVEGVRSGETFSLPLGGIRGNIEVEAVLRSDQGCRMAASVAEAVLHD
ncbi:hypothetical protein ACLGIH_27160 [Streptomyces sp. HMX87]|uniref:hypothetical protein n=1 Tax=Streptomyces sp. HMX87 TaxID=3390849 RepID=UPI003A8B8FE3